MQYCEEFLYCCWYFWLVLKLTEFKVIDQLIHLSLCPLHTGMLLWDSGLSFDSILK